MNLHDFIILMILPIGTSGYKEIQCIKYTIEYIPKLQIHQQKYPQRGCSWGLVAAIRIWRKMKG